MHGERMQWLCHGVWQAPIAGVRRNVWRVVVIAAGWAGVRCVRCGGEACHIAPGVALPHVWAFLIEVERPAGGGFVVGVVLALTLVGEAVVAAAEALLLALRQGLRVIQTWDALPAVTPTHTPSCHFLARKCHTVIHAEHTCSVTARYETNLSYR